MTMVPAGRNQISVLSNQHQNTQCTRPPSNRGDATSGAELQPSTGASSVSHHRRSTSHTPNSHPQALLHLPLWGHTRLAPRGAPLSRTAPLQTLLTAAISLTSSLGQLLTPCKLKIQQLASSPSLWARLALLALSMVP